jgi:hypothetical protein
MTQEQKTCPTPGELLKVAGDVWGMGEALADAMREAQTALMGGDARAAVKAMARGRRVAERAAADLAAVTL